MGTKYTASTGKTTTFKLTSTIEQVLWSRRAAAPGGRVSIEIYTHFVGNGSALQIELTDATGKKHGTFQSAIAGNRLWAPVVVPAGAKQALIATVKLPDHGLEMSSPPLLVIPPIEIKEPAWSAEEAQRGDVLTLSVKVKGAPDGTEATLSIWEHDSDGAHDLITQFPAYVQGGEVKAEWEFEYHEDTDDIPTDPEVEPGYSHPEYLFRVEVGGIEKESPLLKFKDQVQFSFTEADGAPQESIVEVQFEYADGSSVTRTPDGDGNVDLKDVPPGPVSIKQIERKPR